jgi:hypothetical protein
VLGLEVFARPGEVLSKQPFDPLAILGVHGAMPPFVAVHDLLGFLVAEQEIGAEPVEAAAGDVPVPVLVA